MNRYAVVVLACVVLAADARGAETMVTLGIAGAKGAGAPIGTVRLVDTPHGLAFYPDLKGLTPGLHGFHVHQNPSCKSGLRDGKSVPAMAAGDHLDPHATRRHAEPWGDGHLGDLPALYVSEHGSAKHPVLAPRLKLADVADRALMVHAGGDNHSDHPAPLGGGGARIACGVIGG